MGCAARHSMAEGDRVSALTLRSCRAIRDSRIARAWGAGWSSPLSRRYFLPPRYALSDDSPPPPVLLLRAPATTHSRDSLPHPLAFLPASDMSRPRFRRGLQEWLLDFIFRDATLALIRTSRRSVYIFRVSARALSTTPCISCTAASFSRSDGRQAKRGTWLHPGRRSGLQSAARGPLEDTCTVLRWAFAPRTIYQAPDRFLPVAPAHIAHGAAKLVLNAGVAGESQLREAPHPSVQLAACELPIPAIPRQFGFGSEASNGEERTYSSTSGDAGTGCCRMSRQRARERDETRTREL
ncbi:hypothetical protein C8R44DRAFT_975921 [Mycena epipterygia]|nr:hypothetical protein C8R44DRAFT_975921 [Mycena epipterygia]